MSRCFWNLSKIHRLVSKKLLQNLDENLSKDIVTGNSYLNIAKICSEVSGMTREEFKEQIDAVYNEASQNLIFTFNT